MQAGEQRLIIATCEKGTVEDMEEMKDIKSGIEAVKARHPNFVEVAAREALTLSAKCLSILSAHTGQPFEKVKRDSDRDYYMTAEEACAYGLVDKVLESQSETPVAPVKDK